MARIAIVALVLTALAAWAWSQEAEKPGTTASAPAPAGVDEAVEGKAPAGTVTVVSVSGPAQKLTTVDGEDKWAPVKAGDTLAENTVIRTGLRAKVVLRFEDRAEVTVNSATKMGVAEFRKDGPKARMDLGLKYGTMTADVKQGKGPSDFQVSTPVATLSVRGTGGVFGHTGDMGTNVKGLSGGNWNVGSNSSGKHKQIGPGERTTDKLTPSIGMRQMARSTRMGDFFGLTGKEARNLTRNGTGRGLIGFFGNGGQARKILPKLPILPLPQPPIIVPLPPPPICENGYTGGNGRAK